MAVPSTQHFPPSYGVMVGLHADQQHSTRRGLFAGTILFTVSVLGVIWLGAFAALSELQVTVWLLVLLVCSLLSIVFGILLWLLAKVIELSYIPTLVLSVAGVEYAVGNHSLSVSWGQVESIYIRSNQGGHKVLCVGVSEFPARTPSSFGWRLKARINKQRYGAVVVVPMLNTGLTESGILDAVQTYSNGIVT